MRFLTSVACVLAFAVGCVPAAETQVRAVWKAGDVAGCRRGTTVGPDVRGGVTLIDGDLLQDEIGDTVHPHSKAASEHVAGKVWIKKEFLLETAAARGAELCILAGGLHVTFNGTHTPYQWVYTRPRPYNGVFPKDKFPKGHGMRHLNGKPFREYWRGGWTRIPIDVKLLRKGINTVVIRAKDGKSAKFLIEPSLHPNRSAVSRDGGATWDYDRLSRRGNINGEYVVRLRLKRHPADGWIESEPTDLWPREAAGPVARPARIVAVTLTADADAPTGAALRLMARLGPSPAYDPATWSPWSEPAELAAGRLGGKPLADADYRFCQWRVELAASADRLKAPHLAGVTVSATVRSEPIPAGLPIASCTLDQPAIVRPSHRFVHARNTRRLKLLRKQCKLDEVVKGKARGMEQLHAISVWIARMSKKKELNNNRGSLRTDSTWDALLIWNTGRGPAPLTGRMCTHRGAFFAQCATALGYAARCCTWSHAVAEAWVDELGAWVVFDPSGGFYLELAGRPAGMTAVSLAWNGQVTGQSERQVRKCWGPANKSKPEPNRNLAWYTRFWVSMRSNFLESAEPGEAGHGYSHFKYDGDLRWLHPKKEPLPWFANTTSRAGDFEFTVNSVNLHIARTAEADTLGVLIETDTPNLARYEARFGGGEWTKTKAGFPWKLAAGLNTLEVRTVSTFDVPGRVSRVQVRVGK